MEEKNSFWKTEKGKAAIKLGLWMIFIIILIVVVLFSEKNEVDNTFDDMPEDNNDTPEVVYDFENYNDMQERLIQGNYEYIYTITTESNKYIYSGSKADGKEMGFREDGTSVIKYYVDSNGTYQINLDNAVPLSNLYPNFDSSYLDLPKLFDNLSEILYSVDKREEKRVITYDKEGYQVVVNTDLENITSILITVDTTTYELEFTKIGECATIDFSV